MRRSLTIGGPGQVTRVLLAINVAMFVVEIAFSGANSLLLGSSPQKLYQLGGTLGYAIVLNHQYWRLFSAMFLVGQTTGAFLFGWVAHAAGYAIMWSALTVLLTLGGALSTRLARPPAR